LNDSEYSEFHSFELIKELKIPDYLNEYFNNMKIYLSKIQKNPDQTEIEHISNQIIDYVMSKLYKKMFPPYPDGKDLEVFKNCILLSWTEPKHFIEGKANYVYDTFLPDVIKYIKLIEKEKSPRKKIMNLSNVFTSIFNFEKFNGGKAEMGVDDIVVILNYAIIKAKPKQLYSNIKYMSLFLGKDSDKLQGSQLAQLQTLSNFISSINYKSLLNITKEEFEKNIANYEQEMNHQLINILDKFN